MGALYASVFKRFSVLHTVRGENKDVVNNFSQSSGLCLLYEVSLV